MAFLRAGLFVLNLAALAHSRQIDHIPDLFGNENTTLFETVTKYYVTCPCDQSSSVGWDAPAFTYTGPGGPFNYGSATVPTIINSLTSTSAVDRPGQGPDISILTTYPDDGNPYLYRHTSTSTSTSSSSTSLTTQTSSTTSTTTTSSYSVPPYSPSSLPIGIPFSVQVHVGQYARLSKKGSVALGFSDGEAITVSSVSQTVALVFTTSGTLAIYEGDLLVAVQSTTGLQSLTLVSSTNSIANTLSWSAINGTLSLAGADFCVTTTGAIEVAYGSLPVDCTVATLSIDTDPSSFNTNGTSTSNSTTTSGTVTTSAATSTTTSGSTGPSSDASAPVQHSNTTISAVVAVPTTTTTTTTGSVSPTTSTSTLTSTSTTSSGSTSSGTTSSGTLSSTTSSGAPYLNATSSTSTTSGDPSTSTSSGTTSSSVGTSSTSSSSSITNSTTSAITSSTSTGSTTTISTTTTTSAAATCVNDLAQVGSTVMAANGDRWVNFFSGCDVSMDWAGLPYNSLYVYMRSEWTQQSALADCVHVAERDGSAVFEFETDVNNGNRYICWTYPTATDDSAQFQAWPYALDSYGFYLPSRLNATHASSTTTTTTTTAATTTSTITLALVTSSSSTTTSSTTDVSSTTSSTTSSADPTSSTTTTSDSSSTTTSSTDPATTSSTIASTTDSTTASTTESTTESTTASTTESTTASTTASTTDSTTTSATPTPTASCDLAGFMDVSQSEGKSFTNLDPLSCMEYCLTADDNTLSVVLRFNSGSSGKGMCYCTHYPAAAAIAAYSLGTDYGYDLECASSLTPVTPTTTTTSSIAFGYYPFPTH